MSEFGDLEASTATKAIQKQEELEASVNGVNSRLDKMVELISNATVVEDDNIDANEEQPQVSIKLKKSDADLLKEEMTQLLGISKNLVSETVKLNETIASIEAKQAEENLKMVMAINDLDQHFRLHNAIFHNMRLPPVSYDDYGKIIYQTGYGAKFCQFIADQINYYLPNLSVPVSLHNIDIAHPLKNNSRDQPVVIVRFVNRHIRNEILEKENKDVLKSHGIGVTEQLTPKNMKLFNDTKDVVGVENVWSRNGKIFARTAEPDGKVVVTLKTEPKKLTAPPPREVRPFNRSKSYHPRPKPSVAGQSNPSAFQTPNNPPISEVPFQRDVQTKTWDTIAPMPLQSIYCNSQGPFMSGNQAQAQIPPGFGRGLNNVASSGNFY